MNKQREFLAFCNTPHKESIIGYASADIEFWHRVGFNKGISLLKEKYIQLHGDGLVKELPSGVLPSEAMRVHNEFEKMQEFLQYISDVRHGLRGDDENFDECISRKFLYLYFDGNYDLLNTIEPHLSNKILKNEDGNGDKLSQVEPYENSDHVVDAERIKTVQDIEEECLLSFCGKDCKVLKKAKEEATQTLGSSQDSIPESGMFSGSSTPESGIIKKDQPVTNCHQLNPRTTKASVSAGSRGFEGENERTTSITSFSDLGRLRGYFETLLAMAAMEEDQKCEMSRIAQSIFNSLSHDLRLLEEKQRAGSDGSTGR